MAELRKISESPVEQLARGLAATVTGFSRRITAPFVELADDVKELAQHVTEKSQEAVVAAAEAAAEAASTSTCSRPPKSPRHAVRKRCADFTWPREVEFRLEAEDSACGKVGVREVREAVSFAALSLTSSIASSWGMVASPSGPSALHLVMSLTVPAPCAPWAIVTSIVMFTAAYLAHGRHNNASSMTIQRCAAASLSISGCWYLAIGFYPVLFPSSALVFTSMMPYPVCGILLARNLIAQPLLVWSCGRLMRMNEYDMAWTMFNTWSCSFCSFCASASPMCPVSPLCEVIFLAIAFKRCTSFQQTAEVALNTAPVTNRRQCGNILNSIAANLRTHIALQIAGAIFDADPIFVFSLCDMASDCLAAHLLTQSRAAIQGLQLDDTISHQQDEGPYKELVQCMVTDEPGTFTLKDRIFNFHTLAKNECAICLEPSEIWHLWSGCRHTFCEACSNELLVNQKPCPLCRHFSAYVVRRHRDDNLRGKGEVEDTD